MVAEDDTVGAARERRRRSEKLKRRDTGHVDSPVGRLERHGRGCSGGRLSRNQSRISKPRKKSSNKESTCRSKSVSKKKKVPGILGVPVGWNAEDCDYDDSEDETYTPGISRNSSVADPGAGAPAIRYLTTQRHHIPLAFNLSVKHPHPFVALTGG